MKLNDSSKPECVVPIDYFDPTGCGGLCLINTEYCQMLSQKYNVYQCLPRKFLLTCNDYEFNCQNMCINGDKRCDGNIDCSNRLDEKNCGKLSPICIFFGLSTRLYLSLSLNHFTTVITL